MKEFSTAGQSGKDPMLEFSLGGGRKPANSELLIIYRDGTVVYLGANALPLDEAGLYETKLSPADVKSLNDFISEHSVFEMSEEYGPARADSGFSSLTLYPGNTKKKIKWGTFAKIPAPLAELRTRLLDLIQKSRQHPVETIHATLHAVAEKAEPVQTLRLELLLKNRGTRSVSVFLFTPKEVQESNFRVYAATVEEAGSASPLSFFDKAQPLRLIEPADSRGVGEPIKLSPGEEIKARVGSPFALSNPDKCLLYGFLEFTMNVTLKDKPLAVTCFVMTKPVNVCVAIQEEGSSNLNRH